MPFLYLNSTQMAVSITEILVGLLNISAGLACIGAAVSNCIIFSEWNRIKNRMRNFQGLSKHFDADLSMRLIGLVVVLSASGVVIMLLEVFHRPVFLRRHASHMTSYHGRAIHYLVLTLLATDSVQGTDFNRIFLLWSWCSGGTLAFIAVIFVVLAAYNALTGDQIPLPRSMARHRRGLSHHELIRGETEPLELEKTDTSRSACPKSSSFTIMSSSLCDPFQRAAMDQVLPNRPSWSSQRLSSLAELPSPRPSSSASSRPVTLATLKQSELPRMTTRQDGLQPPISAPPVSFSLNRNSIGGGSDRHGSRPNTANSTKSQKSSKRSLLGLYSQSPPNPSQIGSLLLPRKSSECNIRYETTQERLGHQEAAERNAIRPHLDLDACEYYHQLNFEEAEESVVSSDLHHSEGMKSNNRVKELGLKPGRNRKRVYVPSVGTFDLSSGSESEGERSEAKCDDASKILTGAVEDPVKNACRGEVIGDDDDDDDDASVYSLDESEYLSGSRDAGTRKLGRKLTKLETKRNQGKLHRGIQRAMSQRGLS
jgi:hypothetical protein